MNAGEVGLLLGLIIGGFAGYCVGRINMQVLPRVGDPDAPTHPALWRHIRRAAGIGQDDGYGDRDGYDLGV